MHEFYIINLSVDAFSITNTTGWPTYHGIQLSPRLLAPHYESCIKTDQCFDIIPTDKLDHQRKLITIWSLRRKRESWNAFLYRSPRYRKINPLFADSKARPNSYFMTAVSRRKGTWNIDINHNYVYKFVPFLTANTILLQHKYQEGTRWRSRLRHCTTSRKVAGSILDGVTGIFHWYNPSGRTVALASTQPLTEMSTRNTSWG